MRTSGKRLGIALSTIVTAAWLSTVPSIPAQGSESATEKSQPLKLEEIKTLDQVRQLGPWVTNVEIDSGLGVLESIETLELPGLSSTDPRKGALKKINELRSKLTSPDEDREEIVKQLKGALKECFIGDMRQRVHELDEIKAQVAEMERKLEKRLQSREEAVELQLKIFLNEADGLGFFRAEDTPRTGAKKSGRGPAVVPAEASGNVLRAIPANP